MSTDPAPIPKGIVSKSNHKKEGLKEYPNKAPAVRIQLKNTTFPIPNFFNTHPLEKDDKAVPKVVTIAKIPAASRGKFKFNLILGQAIPSTVSGKPKEINDKYITPNNKILLMIITPIFLMCSLFPKAPVLIS